MIPYADSRTPRPWPRDSPPSWPPLLAISPLLSGGSASFHLPFLFLILVLHPSPFFSFAPFSLSCLFLWSSFPLWFCPFPFDPISLTGSLFPSLLLSFPVRLSLSLSGSLLPSHVVSFHPFLSRSLFSLFPLPYLVIPFPFCHLSYLLSFFLSCFPFPFCPHTLSVCHACSLLLSLHFFPFLVLSIPLCFPNPSLLPLSIAFSSSTLYFLLHLLFLTKILHCFSLFFFFFSLFGFYFLSMFDPFASPHFSSRSGAYFEGCSPFPSILIFPLLLLFYLFFLFFFRHAVDSTVSLSTPD